MGETRPMLSVVLPAYLEEENLRLLLPRIASSLEGIGVSSEVIVVDSMAPLDATAAVAAAAGATAMARAGGNTYGDAVRTGIAASRGEWVIFMDADGSHPPEWIAKLFSSREGKDLVIASRYVESGVTENSLGLVLMSRILNWTYSVVLGIPVKDVSNSFRLYRGDMLRTLRLSCNHFDIVEEILIKLLRVHGDLRILEIPVTFKKRMFGDSKRNLMAFALGYVFTLLKLRFFLDIWGEFLRYCVVGTGGALMNLGVFTLATRWLDMGINQAAVLAFTVAVTQNFALNRLWTFGRSLTAHTHSALAWSKYVAVNLLGLGINLVILNTTLNSWGDDYATASQAIGVIAGMASNFLLSRYFVFRPTLLERKGAP